MKCPYCGENAVYGDKEICEEPFDTIDRTGFVRYYTATCTECERTMVLREVFVFDYSRSRAMTETEFEKELEKVKNGMGQGVNKMMRFCAKCGCKVDEGTETDYPWYCPNCDENLFCIETDTERELEYKEILYGLYLHNWVTTHDEGEPVCFSEFLNNEYLDVDSMAYLMFKYSGEF